jgi:hypothetical protein
MKQLLTLLVNLITQLLSSSTKTQSSDPTPNSSALPTSLPTTPVQEIKQVTSDALKKEGLELSVKFSAYFQGWSENDKELVKRIATLNAIKVHELNADELLEFSALLDKASELSKDQSFLLNEFKREFFDATERVVVKAGEIGSKIAVGALIALI